VRSALTRRLSVDQSECEPKRWLRMHQKLQTPFKAKTHNAKHQKDNNQNCTVKKINEMAVAAKYKDKNPEFHNAYNARQKNTEQ
jgi:hypothetical protein